MKVLVAVKRAIDYNVKARPKSDGSGVELANVKMSMNPFDEIAVEEAVKLQEAGKASETIAVSIGPKQCQETLRTAMAMGIDRSILVETDDEVQPLAVAKVLAKLVQQENPEVVILGKQAIDDDSNQTGQMLSAILGWSQGTFACSLEIDEKSVKVGREIDGGIQTLSLTLPTVITTDLRLNEPRYVKLPNIMKAKKKPMDTVTTESLGVDTSPRLTTIRVSEPPGREAGVKVENIDQLIDKLRNEAKVI